MKKILDLIKNKSGQALVEFSIILPLILALILGMIEFGWIFNGKITVTSAAREGARVAVIYESDTQATDAVDKAVKRSTEGTSLKDVESDVDFNETTRSAIVTVTAKISPIVGLYFSEDIELEAKAEMRIE